MPGSPICQLELHVLEWLEIHRLIDRQLTEGGRRVRREEGASGHQTESTDVHRGAGDPEGHLGEVPSSANPVALHRLAILRHQFQRRFETRDRAIVQFGRKQELRDEHGRSVRGSGKGPQSVLQGGYSLVVGPRPVAPCPAARK